ncbi:MAG TPA: DMT family transporter [Bauldia sp.]|nr:DMT family transporter [Bauldia sp.]
MTAGSGSTGGGGRRENIAAGIGLMVLGMFIFSVNDALGKWLAATYTVAQILLFRSFAASIVLVPVLGASGLRRAMWMPRPWLECLRVFLATAETMCFYAAVSVLPLADAVTYYLAGPIYVTLIAALFLGERVGWRRWTAVFVGFGGVLLALQPTTGMFGWHALIAFAGSVIYALFLIVTRMVRGTPETVMAAWQIWTGLLFGVATAWIDWVPIANLSDAFLLGLLGVVALGAIVCVNRSLALAPASVVVPYQYTLIVWAIIFGYAVFGDVPNVLTLIGAAVIVAAGLFIYFRERKVAGEMSKDVVPGP